VRVYELQPTDHIEKPEEFEYAITLLDLMSLE
jgi:hypothetical protein